MRCGIVSLWHDGPDDTEWVRGPNGTGDPSDPARSGARNRPNKVLQGQEAGAQIVRGQHGDQADRVEETSWENRRSQ